MELFLEMNFYQYSLGPSLSSASVAGFYFIKFKSSLIDDNNSVKNS